MENIDVKNMSVDDLKALVEKAKKEIDERKETKRFMIETNEFNTRYHQSAYLARLTFNGTEVEREFIRDDGKYWNKHRYYTSWTFEAKEGDMFEARDYASYKHDRKSYYIVERSKKGNLFLNELSSMTELKEKVLLKNN